MLNFLLDKHNLLQGKDIDDLLKTSPIRVEAETGRAQKEQFVAWLHDGDNKDEEETLANEDRKNRKK